MTSAGELLPKKREDVLVADFETELVVLVPGERRTHRLDVGLSLVLSACDGVTETTALAAEISRGTGDDLGVTMAWIARSLEILAELGVLAEGAVEEPGLASARSAGSSTLCPEPPIHREP